MRRVIAGLVMLGLLIGLTVWAAGPRVRRSCLLGWDAVTENQGGGTISDLAGYRVYVSTSSGTYGAHTLQTNPDTTVATCRQLGLYTHNQQYYVRVTAIDSQSTPNESTPSAELSLVVTMGGVLVR